MAKSSNENNFSVKIVHQGLVITLRIILFLESGIGLLLRVGEGYRFQL